MRKHCLWIPIFFCIWFIPLVVHSSSNQETLTKKDIQSLPHEEIDNNELDSLQYVIEMQEFSKDIFNRFYQLWRLPLFVNLSHDSQQSIDQLNILLKKYDLSVNLKKKEGHYFNDHFNKLYNNFITTGKLSLFESLRVCATIEDLKIFEMNVLESKVDNSDIKLLYKHFIQYARKSIQKIHSKLRYYDKDLGRNMWLW